MDKSSQMIEWSVIQMVISIPDIFVSYSNGDLKSGQFVHYFLPGKLYLTDLGTFCYLTLTFLLSR